MRWTRAAVERFDAKIEGGGEFRNTPARKAVEAIALTHGRTYVEIAHVREYEDRIAKEAANSAGGVSGVDAKGNIRSVFARRSSTVAPDG